MRGARIVAVLLALTLGTAAATGVGAVAGANTSPTSRTVARKAKACTKHRRSRQRRCHPSYRMSAKLLYRGSLPAKLAVPATGVPAPTSTATPTETTPLPPPLPGPVISTVGANAFDMGGFVLRLTRTSVQAGSLTVFFTNHDVSEHNLWLESPGGTVQQISDAIGENASANRTVPVTAGTWRLFCSLPGHEAMTRNLVVTS